MNINYLFESKKENLVLSIGVIVINNEPLIQSCVFDLNEYKKALNNGKECLLDHVELNGSSEVDTYNKNDFINQLKQYNKKYKYVGKIDYDN